jgi:hypothetical protein
MAAILFGPIVMIKEVWRVRVLTQTESLEKRNATPRAVTNAV